MRAQLLKIQATIRSRETKGYPATHPEFTYQFISSGDACTECLFLDGSQYSGATLLYEFPYAEHVSNLVWLAKHHPHCKCTLILTNAKTVCTTLLTEELQTITNP